MMDGSKMQESPLLANPEVRNNQITDSGLSITIVVRWQKLACRKASEAHWLDV